MVLQGEAKGRRKIRHRREEAQFSHTCRAAAQGQSKELKAAFKTPSERFRYSRVPSQITTGLQGSGAQEHNGELRKMPASKGD